MTKEELLAKRQQDEIRMSELAPGEALLSPGIWHSTLSISRYFPNEYQNLKAGSHSNQFATKEQVTRNRINPGRPSRAISPGAGSPLFDMDRWFFYSGYQSVR